MKEPELGDVVLLRGRHERHALGVVVGEDGGTPVLQLLSWQGRRLPAPDKLGRLPGLYGDAQGYAGKGLGAWLEPRYRPLYFRVSGPLRERGRVIAQDHGRPSEAWRSSSLQGGETLLVETTWVSLCDYFLCSGAFDESLRLARDLTSRRGRRRRERDEI